MTGVSRLLALGVLPWLALVTGCGPVTYVSRVTFGASGDVAEARTVNGEQMAPYEYTSAVEHLRRAKELAGYARFHDANNFAAHAQKDAKDARKVAQRRTKNNELPIYNPNDKSMFITRDGFVKRKSSLEADTDYEKPPGLDNEKPPLVNPDQDARNKGGKGAK